MEILVHADKLDRDAVIPVIRDAWGLKESSGEPITLLGPMAKELGLDDFFIGAYSSVDNELLGFVVATAKENDPEAVNIYMLGIRRQYQSSGLGYELMDVLKEELLKNGRTKAVFTMDPFDTRCANLYFSKLGGIGGEFRRAPLSVAEPACHEDFPNRYFRVVWNLDQINPDKEQDYESAMKYLPVVRSTGKDHEEFLLQISPSFRENMRLFSRIAKSEFRRLSELFEHYVNGRGYKLVDFLYSPKNNKAYYKLKRK